MFAWRTTWIVKPGCMEKALEFFETQVQGGPPENAVYRIYTPEYSPNVLVFEETWESMEEQEKHWADLDAAPESEAMWAKWYEIVKGKTGTEVWNLREWR